MSAVVELPTREYPIFAMPRAAALDVLTTSLYPGAKPESAALVLSYCQAAGLDPMDKPVHIVPMQVSTGRKGPDGWDIKEMRDVVMPGIALYRTKAARTGQYAGCDDPVFGPDVQDTLDGVAITYPQWCRVTVHRLVGGHKVSFTATEFWTENYATKSNKSAAPNAMWKKRPYGQLAKCAEAQALRKGFPDAVGGAPTADEMEGKSFDFDLGHDGEVKPVVTMPQRKSEQDTSASAPQGTAETPAPGQREAAPKAPATTAPAGCINAGQVKYLEAKFKSLDLKPDAIAATLARHGAAALDTTITVAQFDAIKSELLAL